MAERAEDDTEDGQVKVRPHPNGDTFARCPVSCENFRLGLILYYLDDGRGFQFPCGMPRIPDTCPLGVWK